MADSILKRRINPFLLISTVAALSLLAGVAVISQDQIDNRQQKIQNLEQQRSDLNSTVNRLRAENSNQSIKIEGLKQNNSILNTKNQRLEENLSSRKTELQNLENNLKNAKENIEELEKINQTYQNMSNSFELVCGAEDPWNSSLAEEECEEWGYNIES